MLKFHENKWVTALPQFSCFRNLTDYNFKWESVIKSSIYRDRKNNAFNNDRVFFLCSLICRKYKYHEQNKTKLSIYNRDVLRKSG